MIVPKTYKQALVCIEELKAEILDIRANRETVRRLNTKLRRVILYERVLGLSRRRVGKAEGG
jgi:hypothetical protein